MERLSTLVLVVLLRTSFLFVKGLLVAALLETTLIAVVALGGVRSLLAWISTLVIILLEVVGLLIRHIF